MARLRNLDRFSPLRNTREDPNNSILFVMLESSRPMIVIAIVGIFIW